VGGGGVSVIVQALEPTSSWLNDSGHFKLELDDCLPQTLHTIRHYLESPIGLIKSIDDLFIHRSGDVHQIFQSERELLTFPKQKVRCIYRYCIGRCFRCDDIPRNIFVSGPDCELSGREIVFPRPILRTD
jgi:hypothetical protein